MLQVPLVGLLLLGVENGVVVGLLLLGVENGVVNSAT